MTGWLDHGAGRIALENVAWMSGNLYLAWFGLLTAWLVLEPRRRAVLSGGVLVAGAVIGAIVLAIAGGSWLDDFPGATVLVLPLLVAAAVLAVLRWPTRRAARIAVVLVAIAFAPNGPYVLTDSLHLVHDLRITQLDSAEAVLFSAMYGTFLVLGVVPWVLLLGLGRRFVRARAGTRGWAFGLVASSLLAAVALYMGRIERVHSYHLVRDPARVLHALGHAFADGGPRTYALAWSLTILVGSVVALWIVDRIRAVGGSGRELVAPTVLVLAGTLLAGVPSLPVWSAQLDLEVVTPNGADAAACLLVGIVLGAIGTARLVTVLGLLVERTPEPTLEENLQPQPSMVPVLALAYIVAVPVVGTLLMGGAVVQRWAQYDGLCAYVPHKPMRNDPCG